MKPQLRRPARGGWRLGLAKAVGQEPLDVVEIALILGAYLPARRPLSSPRRSTSCSWRVVATTRSQPGR